MAGSGFANSKTCYIHATDRFSNIITYGRTDNPTTSLRTTLTHTVTHNKYSYQPNLEPDMNSDLEFQLHFQQSKLQDQIQRELRLLEPELQKLKSEAEHLLCEIEDRTSQLELEQQKLENLKLKHYTQEYEVDQLKKHKDTLNQLMHTHNITHDEILQLQKLYNQPSTWTNTQQHQSLRHI